MLLNPYHSGSGFQVTSSRRNVDEDVNLDVDGDDSEQYGRPQYPCNLRFSTHIDRFE